MKPYLVLSRGDAYEGWSVTECDTFDEAFKVREERISWSNQPSNVIIAKIVTFEAKEIEN